MNHRTNSSAKQADSPPHRSVQWHGRHTPKLKKKTNLFIFLEAGIQSITAHDDKPQQMANMIRPENLRRGRAQVKCEARLDECIGESIITILKRKKMSVNYKTETCRLQKKWSISDSEFSRSRVYSSTGNATFKCHTVDFIFTWRRFYPFRHSPTSIRN